MQGDSKICSLLKNLVRKGNELKNIFIFLSLLEDHVGCCFGIKFCSFFIFECTFEIQKIYDGMAPYELKT